MSEMKKETEKKTAETSAPGTGPGGGGTEEKRERGSAGGHYADRLRIGTRGASWLRQQFGKGITYFLVVAASIIFYFALLRATNLTDVLWRIVDVLKPVLYGLIIAYLLDPIVEKVDERLAPVLRARFERPEKGEKLSRSVGITLAVIFLVLMVAALFNLLIPELYKSIRDLVIALPGQMNDLVSHMNRLYSHDSTVGEVFKAAVQEGTSMVQSWLRTDLLGRVNEIMYSLTEGVINVVSELFNILVGVIVSVYILFSKEKFLRQGKKTVYALLPAHYANSLLHLAGKTNEIFGAFIIGKIIDAALVGVLCFVGISLLNIPYAVLVSVVVGVTNIIPFFGPYIGGVPSAVLILLADPVKGISFIIFIIILQQVDGNFIEPKILGNTTGLSAFWVIFAIFLGGGLFGFVGMLIGVPLFGVVYYIIQMFINSRLEKKQLPSHSDYYDEMSYVDDNGTYVRSQEPSPGKESVRRGEEEGKKTDKGE